MRRVAVPALVRTRVAGSFAKRMPVTVRIDVRPERPDDVIVGLIEVEKSPFPFVKGQRSEQVLIRSQVLDIGAVYASYGVFVTSEKPVTLAVEVRSAIRMWLIVAASLLIWLVAVLVFFLGR
ncbi:MAG TPA: hypothetical protein VFN03_00895 [Trueperaceae bacterium]|nr:hypothetical protein [Trueperaceae bacterium]